MAADQGLIQASLKEAQSRVGVDKTKFYESQAAIPLATSAGMVEIFQKKNKEKQKAWDDIAEPVEVMMRQLASGSEQLGGMHPANVTRFKELQKEFNAAYGDKEKEDKIKFKIQQVAAEINGLAAGFTKFGEAYIGKDLIINEDDKFYSAFGKIWDVDGKYDDVSFSWDENNKLNATIDGETQKVTDLFKELHLKDATSVNGIGKIGVGLRNATAKNTNKWQDEKDIFQASINKLMPDKSSYLNIIEDETLTGISFKKALSTLLDTDTSNDDKTLLGILGNQDKQKLYDTIVNPNSDNLESGKEIVSRWFTEGYGNSKFIEGENARTKERIIDPNDKDPDGYFGWTYAPDPDNPGKEKQIDPTKASAVYDHLQNKTKNFQGSSGYYAKLKSPTTGEAMYLRYASYEDFVKDKKDGDLSSDQKQWKAMFGEKSAKWNANRFIPMSRVIEIEAATKIPKGRK